MRNCDLDFTNVYETVYSLDFGIWEKLVLSHAFCGPLTQIFVLFHYQKNACFLALSNVVVSTKSTSIVISGHGICADLGGKITLQRYRLICKQMRLVVHLIRLELKPASSL